MKNVTILSLEEARQLVEDAKAAKQRYEIHSKEQARLKLLEEERDPDEVAYELMLSHVASSIKIAASSIETEMFIRIGPKQFETIENKRKRNALNRLKPILREMGYQTSWNHDIWEDDGFNRECYDTFTVSWDPSIRWNEFRY